MLLVLLLIINSLIFLFLNMYRFQFASHINRMIFIAAGVIFTVGNILLLGFEHSGWLGFFLLYIFAAVYGWMGAATIAAVMAGLLLLFNIYTLEVWVMAAGGYVFFGLSTGGILYYFRRHNTQLKQWQEFFYKQSKNLHVLREVSLALQSTLKLDKVMHIFLTAVTAGYGLGFNRAFILLQEESNPNQYSGRLGIGPLSMEEGHVIWENVVMQKLTLRDFIKLQREAEVNDQELNRKIRSYSFTINEKQPLCHHVLTEMEPIIVKGEVDKEDSLLKHMKETFSMKEFAVIPLLTRGKVIGLMIIDNIVDNEPIKHEDLDNIMPLATQGAMAIENAMLYEKSENTAIEDALTGLKNKRFLDRMLPHLLESAAAKNNCLTALVLDIDHFKSFNDTHGHLLGNEILIQFAKLLEEAVAKEDIVCRFGGEEFIIFLPKKSLRQGEKTAELIRKAVRTYPFDGRETQPLQRITVSIGVASYPELAESGSDLIQKADEAVYRAKKKGRDQVAVYSEQEREVYL
ncbi:sensor domain-containing diguanylate cyclase [Salipaludibacillus sp. CUR1]|uniref:sensor domain-containing diguanylate cyclase n=1 Tax=Salipaludibacillus sp. CUR1 TaxID=2820003 RepID=UPI001E60AEB5|nr:diguanylate cyclase [Salipaludibacillus sp. CUR1]MCE7792108.1 sensor domain-containing diguanylate cyclase [Salipaludibacillus sp. CUR1]